MRGRDTGGTSVRVSIESIESIESIDSIRFDSIRFVRRRMAY